MQTRWSLSAESSFLLPHNHDMDCASPASPRTTRNTAHHRRRRIITGYQHNARKCRQMRLVNTRVLSMDRRPAGRSEIRHSKNARFFIAATLCRPSGEWFLLRAIEDKAERSKSPGSWRSDRSCNRMDYIAAAFRAALTTPDVQITFYWLSRADIHRFICQVMLCKSRSALAHSDEIYSNFP